MCSSDLGPWIHDVGGSGCGRAGVERILIDNGGPVVAGARLDVDLAHHEIGQIHVARGTRGVAVR